jgi:hypothetical protein
MRDTQTAVQVTYLHKQTPQTRTGGETTENTGFPKESLGRLVALGFDVAVFTPAPYQRHRL